MKKLLNQEDKKINHIDVVISNWMKQTFRTACFDNGRKMSNVLGDFIPYYTRWGEDIFYLLRKFELEEMEQLKIDRASLNYPEISLHGTDIKEVNIK